MTSVDGTPSPNSFTPEEYNQYVSAQIEMPLGDEKVIATAKRTKHGINGKQIGIYNENPLLDTSIYRDELPDVTVE